MCISIRTNRNRIWKTTAWPALININVIGGKPRGRRWWVPEHRRRLDRESLLQSWSETSPAAFFKRCFATKSFWPRPFNIGGRYLINSSQMISGKTCLWKVNRLSRTKNACERHISEREIGASHTQTTHLDQNNVAMQWLIHVSISNSPHALEVQITLLLRFGITKFPALPQFPKKLWLTCIKLQLGKWFLHILYISVVRADLWSTCILKLLPVWLQSLRKGRIHNDPLHFSSKSTLSLGSLIWVEQLKKCCICVVCLLCHKFLLHFNAQRLFVYCVINILTALWFKTMSSKCI